MLLGTFLAYQVAVQNKFLQAKNTRSDVTVVSSSEFSENANSFFRKFVSRTIFIRSQFLPFAPLLFIVLFFSKRQKGAPKVALLAQEKNTSLKNKEFHCGQG